MTPRAEEIFQPCENDSHAILLRETESKNSCTVFGAGLQKLWGHKEPRVGLTQIYVSASVRLSTTLLTARIQTARRCSVWFASKVARLLPNFVLFSLKPPPSLCLQCFFAFSHFFLSVGSCCVNAWRVNSRPL